HAKQFLAAVAAALGLCTSPSATFAAQATTLPDAAELRTMTARFAPVDIRVDLSRMPANERKALGEIIRAAQIIDAIYLRQVAPHNETQLLLLLQDHTPLGQARLQYFLINKGPWSELDLDRPFVPGAGERPAQAGFYPADATRAEIEAWMGSL